MIVANLRDNSIVFLPRPFIFFVGRVSPLHGQVIQAIVMLGLRDRTIEKDALSSEISAVPM